MCWSSGRADGPPHRASCLSRSRSLVCKILIALLGLSETNTIGYVKRWKRRLMAGLSLRRKGMEERYTPRSRDQAKPYDFYLGGASPYWSRRHSAMMVSQRLRQEVHHGSDRAADASPGTFALHPRRLTMSGGRAPHREPHCTPPETCARFRRTGEHKTLESNKSLAGKGATLCTSQRTRRQATLWC